MGLDSTIDSVYQGSNEAITRLLSIPVIIFSAFTGKIMSKIGYIMQMPFTIGEKISQTMKLYSAIFGKLNTSLLGLTSLGPSNIDKLKTSIKSIFDQLLKVIMIYSYDNFNIIVETITKKFIDGFIEAFKIIPPINMVLSTFDVADKINSGVMSVFNSLANFLNKFNDAITQASDDMDNMISNASGKINDSITKMNNNAADKMTKMIQAAGSGTRITHTRRKWRRRRRMRRSGKRISFYNR